MARSCRVEEAMISVEAVDMFNVESKQVLGLWIMLKTGLYLKSHGRQIKGVEQESEMIRFT